MTHHSFLDMYGLFILIGGFIVAVIAIFFHVLIQDKQMNKLLDLASRRLGGKVVGKGMGHPELRLEHSGVPGTIKFYKEEAHNQALKKFTRYSVLVFELPQSSPMAMHLCTKGFQSDLSRHAVGPPSQIQDSHLAHLFDLRTSDEHRANALLRADVCKAIERLRRLDRKGHLEIFVFERELIIRFPIYLNKSDHVLGLGFMGQKILDGFLAAAGWAGDMPQKAAQRERCAECRQPIDPPGQTCSFCSAHLHLDCWQLLDHCPGCGAPTEPDD